jgi:hypothetical protein
MMKLRTVRTAVYAVLVLAFTLTTDAFQNPQARRSPKSSSLMVTPAKDEYKQALLNDRRKAMGSIFGAAAIAAALVTTGRIEDARALDMDAFVNSQVRGLRSFNDVAVRAISFVRLEQRSWTRVVSRYSFF